MATKRGSGKGDLNGEASGAREANQATSKEKKSEEHDTRRKHRQIHKQQATKEKRREDTIRWIVIGLVLILAAIGLYYYFSYANSGLPPAQTSRRTGTKAGSEKRKEGKGSPSKKTTKGKEQADAPSTDKKKTAKKSTKTTPSSKSTSAQAQSKKKKKSQAEQQKPEIEEPVDPRVLRRPYKPDDPDRPHLVDLLSGDNLLLEGKYSLAMEKFNEVLKHFPQSTRAMYGKGIALRHMAREKRSNKLLDTSIDFLYKAGMEAFLGSDDVRIEALYELADTAYERGKTQLAIRALEKLTEFKPEDEDTANRLGMGYLAVGNHKKAKAQFKKVLEEFKDSHFAKAQLGFILFSDKKYEEALPLLMEGIREDEGIKMNPKFYLYAGDALIRLNRSDEAMVLFGEGVSLGLFPSVWQRSLVNEPGLRATPWWSVSNLKYINEIRRIEKAIENITEEALAVFDEKTGTFQTKQLSGAVHYVLFKDGKKIAANCQYTPRTCAVIETFPEAAGCKRGSVKFSTLPPRTHIYPYVETTNTKLQITVGLVLDVGLRIRLADDARILEQGQIAIVDESFEQELWYMGAKPSLFLTVDVWHPDLTQETIKKLGPLS